MNTLEQLSTSAKGNYDFWTQDAKFRLAFVFPLVPGCRAYEFQSKSCWKLCKQALRNRKSQKWLNENLKSNKQPILI